MSDEKPLTSIIVPVYNVEKYLDECLQSIVSQSYTNIEILLIDDGSLDASGDICDEWSIKDSRVKVIHQKNAGAAAAKNTGLRNMSGDLFVIVDSDDILASDILLEQWNVMKETGADIVESELIKFNDGSELPYIRKIEEVLETFNAEQALAELMQNRKLHQTPVCKLYKVQLAKKVEFVPGTYIDDEFWTYRIFGNAIKIVKFPRAGYFYRQHSSSTMGRAYSVNRTVILDAFEQRIYYMEQRFPELVLIAVRTYLGTCIYHYQKLCEFSDIKESSLYKAKIRTNYKKVYKKYGTSNMDLKKRIRFIMFRLCPEGYCKINLLLGKGK